MEFARDFEPVDLAGLPAGAAALIERLEKQVERQGREIALRDAKLEKITFELARLKRWNSAPRVKP